MAPINYLPGMPGVPCPGKYMIIYGHTPTPPPPATLTQEQLARDAGHLVQAHAALDKLVGDTDRNANSLLDRIQQVVNCTEEVNKVLDSAAINRKAGIVECVKTLKRRCDHHAKVSSDRAEEVGKLQLNIHDLKARNRRLHDAQGSGNSAVAELINVRKRLLSSFPGKTVEEAAIALGGITTEGVVEQLVEALKGQPNAELERVREILSKLTHRSDRGVAGMAQDAVTMNLNQRGMIEQLRAEAGKDPALDKLVQQAHDELDDAKVSPRTGNIVERVRSLVEERDRLKNDVGYRPLYDMVQQAHRKLNDAGFTTRDDLNIEQRVERMIADNRELHRCLENQAKLILGSGALLDRAGIPNGALPERVRVAIERGQEAKPKPWKVKCLWGAWNITHSDGRTFTCTSRELAEQICETLNRQEAR